MFWTKKVKCEICKHWVDKSDAQEVLVEGYYYWGELKHRYSEYYCNMHKRDYEGVLNLERYKKFVVDESGEPIGYKKIETKK